MISLLLLQRVAVFCTYSNLVFKQMLPRDTSPVAAPLVIWQKVFGQLVKDGLWFGGALEVGFFLHKQFHIFFQQGNVNIRSIFLQLVAVLL